MFVREKIALSCVSVEYIPTELMLADPLTKALAPKVFREHVTHMGLFESTYICWVSGSSGLYYELQLKWAYVLLILLSCMHVVMWYWYAIYCVHIWLRMALCIEWGYDGPRHFAQSQYGH